MTRMLARGGWRVRRIVPQYSAPFLLYSLANWLAHRGREGQASRCREIAENRRQRLLRRLLGLALGLSGQSGCMICVAERQ